MRWRCFICTSNVVFILFEFCHISISRILVWDWLCLWPVLLRYTTLYHIPSPFLVLMFCRGAVGRSTNLPAWVRVSSNVDSVHCFHTPALVFHFILYLSSSFNETKPRNLGIYLTSKFHRSHHVLMWSPCFIAVSQWNNSVFLCLSSNYAQHNEMLVSFKCLSGSLSRFICVQTAFTMLYLYIKSLLFPSRMEEKFVFTWFFLFVVFSVEGDG